MKYEEITDCRILAKLNYHKDYCFTECFERIIGKHTLKLISSWSSIMGLNIFVRGCFVLNVIPSHLSCILFVNLISKKSSRERNIIRAC